MFIRNDVSQSTSRTRLTSPARICLAFAALLAVTVAFVAWSSNSAHAATGSAASATAAKSSNPYPEVKGKMTSKQCNADKAAGEITDVTSFGFGASPGTIDPEWALKAGYFKKLCLNVRIISANSQAALISADTAQVTSTSSAGNVIGYREFGDQVIGVETIGKVLPQAIILNKSIKNLKGLEGKTFGYYQNMSDTYVAMFEKAGVDLSKVKMVLLTNRDPRLVTNNTVQGIATFNGSQNVQLNEDGLQGQYNQVTAASLGLKGVTNVMYMSSKFVQQHPVAAENFIRADIKALGYCVVHPGPCVTQLDNVAAAAGQGTVYGPAQNVPQWNFQMGTVKFHGTKPLGTFTKQMWAGEYNQFKTYGYETNILNHLTGPNAAVHLPPLTSTFNNKMVKNIYNSSGQLIWP